MSPASSRRCGEQRQVCAGLILPLGGKDQDSGNEEVVERDPTQGIELKETHAQRVSQRRCRIHFSESELRETNPRVFFVVCLITLHSSFTLCFRSIYLVVVFLCVQGF